jgi:hypothetical protein
VTSDLPGTARGYDAHEVVSALQKAIRRSDPDAALYWTFELANSGLRNWLWKRLRVIAVEDCSPEAVGLVADINALNVQWQDAQKRSDGHEILFVARAAISLATAPKSRVVDWAAWHHGLDHSSGARSPTRRSTGTLAAVCTWAGASTTSLRRRAASRRATATWRTSRPSTAISPADESRRTRRCPTTLGRAFRSTGRPRNLPKTPQHACWAALGGPMSTPDWRKEDR